jgi:cellulose synthase/poly-beta-1,6-N-acetylglucosamine synthase-like glycosyltransferase
MNLFSAIIVLICIYTFRHYCFTLNRLFGRQRHPYEDLQSAVWPPITVLIAAHNEEAVVADIIKALLEADYPREKMTIIPVNDRSTDRTREIVEGFAELHPSIEPFHRVGGKPGKAAALKEAMLRVNTEIVLILDAPPAVGGALLRSRNRRRHGASGAAECGRKIPHALARSGAFGRLPG